MFWCGLFSWAFNEFSGLLGWFTDENFWLSKESTKIKIILFKLNGFLVRLNLVMFLGKVFVLY